MDNKPLSDRGSDEPTIRFTVDPDLLKRPSAPQRLEDTYVGAPLLAPEDMPKAAARAAVPLWVRVAVVCAMGMLALSLLVTFLPRPWFGPTAQETVDQFVTALDTGDFALLRTVAAGDGVELTEQTVAPLFAASRSDPDFAQSVRRQLQVPIRGAAERLLWLEDRSNALRSDYVVHVGVATGHVRSNLPEARITVGGADAVWDEAQGAAVAHGLLPGLYEVRGVYETPHGGAFHADATLYVQGPDSGCALQFDYATMEVYNSAAVPIQIRVNGSDYATLEPQKELVVGPVTADAQITAVGPSQQHLSATAAEGYFYVSFATCQLEIYNDYAVPMHVSLGGQWYADIPAQGKLSIADVPAGQELTAYLDEGFGTEPFRYQAAYDFDYLYPAFALEQENFEAMRLTAETYALVAYEAYGQGAEALAQLPDTALTRELAALWDQPERSALTAEQIVLSEYGSMAFLPDGALQLTVTVDVLELAQPLPDENQEAPLQAPQPLEQGKRWTLRMELRQGTWSVLPDPAPTQPEPPEPPEQPEETPPPQPE